MKRITFFILAFLSTTIGFAQGLETFDNATDLPSGTQYGDGSFVGNDGITWTYTHALSCDNSNGTYCIDGSGILLRRANEPSSISATIEGGIGSFSVDTRKAFTGNTQRKIELVINDDVIEQFEPEFGDGEDDTIIPFVVDDINVSGEFTLELRLYGADGNQQIVLDNIEWTGYGDNDNGEEPCDIEAPTGDAEQTLEEGQTLDDLVVEGEDDAVFTWYADEDLEDEIDADTEAEGGVTYYVVQTVEDCTSEALAITVTIEDDGETPTFPDPYCNIGELYWEVEVEEITHVEFGDDVDINNTNDEDPLIDFTSEVAEVTIGETYTLTVQGNTWGDYENEFIAFIDWNQNGTLDDDGEIYNLGTIFDSDGYDSENVSIEITVPTDAEEGQTRIRILKVYVDSYWPELAYVNPCYIANYEEGYEDDPYDSYGQALDFTLNISSDNDTEEPCDIDAPTGEAEQTLDESQTLADLIIEGEEDATFTWYADEDLENEIDADTEAEDGTTYYVVQTVGDCTSEALAITVTTVPTSADNFDRQAFKVYPNPVKEIVNISYSENISDVAVINMLGQTLIRKTVQANETQIDMGALAKGNYLIKVNINGSVHTVKISK